MTNKISSILSPTDFSEASLNALQTAASLAAKCDAKLYILHAQDNILEFIGFNTGTVKSVENNASDILMALGNEIQQKFKIDATIVEQKGQANEVILKTAARFECDLIVAGTCGASGYRNSHIGYTAYSIVKYAICPVILIPPGKRILSFKKPLFPVRPIHSALQHIKMASELFERDATLDIFGLYPYDEKDSLYDLKELVSKAGIKKVTDKGKIKLEICDTENNIPQKVLMEADRNQSDLIVLSPATDFTTKPFYIGPNTHYIIQNARIALMIIDKVKKYSAQSSKVSV